MSASQPTAQAARVSVVVPAYNAEAFLSETVSCVVQQTYPHWELIIIDDGSTDRTRHVAASFLGDPRVRYVYQENAGVSVARNAGARLTHGAYLAFLDADDLWVETYLSKKVRFLDEHPEIGMVVSQIRAIDPAARPLPKFYSGLARNVVDTILEFRPGAHSTSPSNVLCRRAAFEAAGGFDPRLSNTADKLFYIEMARVASIDLLAEPLVLYREHAGNMHKDVGLMARDYAQFLEVLREKRIFLDPRQEARCRSRVMWAVAGACLEARRLDSGLRLLARAIAASPGTALRQLLAPSRLRRLLFGAADRLGLGRLLLLLQRFRGRVPIVLFHRVSPEPDPAWPPLHPDDFETILGFLARRYEFAALDDLFRKSAAELRRACVVVFDDGFADFYEYAHPILKRHGVPVTVFLAAGCIDRSETLWTSQLDNLLNHTTASSLRLELGGSSRTFPLESVVSRFRSALEIKALLTSVGAQEALAAVEELKRRLGYRKEADPPLLSWEQIRELRLEGVKFQSHSLSHAYLPGIADESWLREELELSKSMIEKQVGDEVASIAYPIGGYSPSVLAVARRTYSAGFAVDDRPVDLKRLRDEEYRFRIPRVNVHDADPRELFFRINGFHGIVQALRGAQRQRAPVPS